MPNISGSGRSPAATYLFVLETANKSDFIDWTRFFGDVKYKQETQLSAE